MKSNKSNVINILLLIVLTSVTFFVIFRNNDIGEIIKLVGSGDKKKLILGLMLAIGSIACEALIIFIMLKFLKEGKRYLSCLKYSFIGFYYCGITPSATGGQPMQVYYMTKDNCRLSSASLIVLIIVITYKVALIGMIGILSLFNTSCMVKGVSEVTFFFFFGLIVNVACIVLYMFVFISSDLVKKILVKSVKFLSKIKIVRKPEKTIDKVLNLVDEYKEGTTFIKNNLKVLIPIMIVTCIQRLLRFSIPYVVYKFLGGSSTSYIDFLTLQIIISTAVDSLPLPGAMGAAELAANKIYAMIYEEALLVPAVVLARGIDFYFMMILTAVVSLWTHLRTMRRCSEENTGVEAGSKL